MSEIVLIEPTMEYADDIWAFRQEINDCDEENEDRFAGCSSLEKCTSGEEWVNL